MSAYWVNFATHGDPNGPGLPAWPVLDAAAPTVMRFNGGVAVGPVPRREILDLWDDCMQHLRAGQ